MREFTIGKNDADQRVDKFLSKALKTLPKSLMYKYIRNKKIKVNRKRCEISQRLIEGDTMQCFIPEEFFDEPINYAFLQVPSQLNILYEDDAFIIVDKPAGLLAHSDQQAIQDNLADRLLHYLYKKKAYDPAKEQSFTPALCHRIDRNTQGIVIAAKTAEALRSMNEAIKLREVDKRYLCIIEGHMKVTNETLVLYHQKGEQNKAVIVAKQREGYKEIKTRYRVLQEKQHHSLVEIELLTGKSHQIRAVMAFLGHPLVGDMKYGAKKASIPYQALCAYQVHFHFQEHHKVFAGLQNKMITIDQVRLLTQWNTIK